MVFADRSCHVQFADIHHFQSLTPFSSSWPAGDISDNATASGVLGSSWNYGSNFGGPLKVEGGFTSGADTVHAGGVGAFGSCGVNDFEYAPVLCTDSTTPSLAYFLLAGEKAIRKHRLSAVSAPHLRRFLFVQFVQMFVSKRVQASICAVLATNMKNIEFTGWLSRHTPLCARGSKLVREETVHLCHGRCLGSVLACMQPTYCSRNNDFLTRQSNCVNSNSSGRHRTWRVFYMAMLKCVGLLVR